MQIFIKLLSKNGKHIALEVEKWDTILSLKEKILDKEGIPIYLHVLRFNNKILDDDKYLWQYNIQSEDDLIFYVNNFADFLIEIAVPPKDFITVHTKNFCDIITIKSLIQQQTGIQIRQQRLILHGKKLQNIKTISECNIYYQCLLYLQVIGGLMIIYIKTPQNQIIRFQLKQEETIQSIKLKIQDREGIPFDIQQLIFAGRTLENMKALKDYEIDNESTLQLVFEDKNMIQIFLKTHGSNIISVDLSTEDTIDQVKQKIADKEGIEPEQKELEFIMKQLENRKIFQQNRIEHSTGLLLSHQTLNIQTQQIHNKDQKQEGKNNEVEKFHTINNKLTNSISNRSTSLLEEEHQQSIHTHNDRIIRLLQKIHEAKSEKEMNLRVNHLCKQIENFKGNCISLIIDVQFCQNLKNQIEQGSTPIQKQLIRIVHSIAQQFTISIEKEFENDCNLSRKVIELNLAIDYTGLFEILKLKKTIQQSGLQKTIEEIMRREIKYELNEFQGGIVKYSEFVIQLIETYSFINESQMIEFQNCESCGRFFVSFFRNLINNLKNQQYTEQNQINVNLTKIRDISIETDEGIRILRSIRRITLDKQKFNAKYFKDNFDIINYIDPLIHVNCCQDMNCPHRVLVPLIQPFTTLQFQFAVFGAIFGLISYFSTYELEKSFEGIKSIYQHLQQIIVQYAINISNQTCKHINNISSLSLSQNQSILSPNGQLPDNSDVIQVLFFHLSFHIHYVGIRSQYAHGIFGAFSILSRRGLNKQQQLNNQIYKMGIVKISQKCVNRIIDTDAEQSLIQMKNQELINEQQFMRQQIEIFGTAGGIEEENIADALCNVSCILDAYNKIKDADDSYVESKKRCLEQSIEEGGIEEIEAHIKHRKFAYPYQFVDPKYPKHTKEAIVNNWKDPTNNQ